MQIYSATLKGPLKISGFIDPDDVTKVSVYWGAATWSQQTVYRQGDVTRPLQDNGYYYQCTTNGVSGNTEPAWLQEETVSGSAVFSAVPWNLWLLPDESLSNSSWSANNNSVSLSDEFFNDYKSSVFVTITDPAILEFELTNHVTKPNGESLSRTFHYKINQQ